MANIKLKGLGINQFGGMGVAVWRLTGRVACDRVGAAQQGAPRAPPVDRRPIDDVGYASR